MHRTGAWNSKFKNLQRNTMVEDLVSYLEKTLPGFKVSDEFIEILVEKKNENQHSMAFCVYMTNRCSSKFCFQRENAQKGSSTIDIGVYRGANLFFTIEAKVLPTPLLGKRKEHEYVYGKGAGIQRFKEENHGVDNRNRLLPENGMIAYIKNKDFEYWHLKVDQWITAVDWPVSEKLSKEYFKTIARLKSEHTRKNSSTLTLYHFWVYVGL